MIATHDGRLVDYAIALNKRHKRSIAYAMLNGINNRYAMQLRARGQKVALYVPFGTDWIGYSYRRLREGGHLRLILQSLLIRQAI